MHDRICRWALVFGVLLTMLSCNKELSYENPSGSDSTTSANFTASIDGVNWSAAASAEAASFLAGLTNLSGVSSDNQQLSIVLDDTVTGVYTLSQSSVSTAVFSDNNTSDAYSSSQGSDTTQSGGTVTVTEIDRVNKTISGTFSFKLYRASDGKQKVFTNGVFNKLSYVDSLPAAAGTDTMNATIAGSAWVAQSILASSFSSSITVAGSKSDGSQAVGLVMPQNITTGTYSLNYSGLTYFGTYSPSVSTGFASSSGTLQILENNTSTRRVRGNFNFTAVDPTGSSTQSYQITNGYFSVTYQ